MSPRSLARRCDHIVGLIDELLTAPASCASHARVAIAGSRRVPCLAHRSVLWEVTMWRRDARSATDELAAECEAFLAGATRSTSSTAVTPSLPGHGRTRSRTPRRSSSAP
jgi:hypothetical protein